jgi:type IV pilus assembly protein PilX
MKHQPQIPYVHRCTGSRAPQRGAALLVALILLVVITLVGLAAIGTTILQNKAASNQHDREVAFQSAEAAMRAAQEAIQTATVGVGTPVTSAALTDAGFEDCSNVFNATPTKCLPNPFDDPAVTSAEIKLVPKTGASSFDAGPLAAMQPQYVVQYMGTFVAPTPKARRIGGQQNYGAASQGELADYYRITARSGDPTQTGGRSIVTLQSTFRN